MKFLLGSNMKMSLIVVGGMNLWWWGDKNLVGWGESTREIFSVEGMNKFVASRGWDGRDSLPISSSRENSVYSLHISQKT